MTPAPVDPLFIEPGIPTPIRVMNDYSADFPIWGPEGGYGPEHWPEFDAELVIALKQFAKLFNESYDYLTGTWPAGFDVDAYFRTGELLRLRVAVALGPAYSVSFWRWESTLTA